MKTKLWKAACIGLPATLIGCIAWDYGLWVAVLSFGCWVWGLHFRDAFAPDPAKHEIRITRED